jgi:putative hydrolase of the HAD superfamily
VITRPGVRSRPDALLVDFDGVVRRCDPTVGADIERRHGLPAGTLAATGTDWHRLRPAISGEVTRDEWRNNFAEAIADRVGGLEPARAVVDEYDRDRGELVAEVLDFIDEVRDAGKRVALVANAMGDFDQILAHHGLTDRFDVIVNSSVLGVHKPAPAFFAAACAAVGTPAQRCLFVDDNDRDVRAARASGLAAYRYTGPADLPYLRAALGI